MPFRIGKKPRSSKLSSSSKQSFFHQKRNTQKLLNRNLVKVEKAGTKKQYSYFIRIILSGFLFIIVIAISLLIFSFWQNSLDLRHSYTVALVPFESQQSPYIVSLRGSEKTVRVIALPRTFTDFDEPVNENMRFIDQLLSNEPQNSNKIRSAFSLKLGIPVDTVMYLHAPIQVSTKSELLEVFSPFKAKQLHTELSAIDLLMIEKYLFVVDPAHVEQSEFFQGKEPNIGSELIQMTQLLNLIQKFFPDTAVRQTSPTIAVINTTTQNGVAKQLGDFFNAWGFSVVQLDSAEEETHQETELIIDEKLIDSPAMRRLRLSFQNELKYKSDQNILNKYRSQMVLFVGQDFTNP